MPESKEYAAAPTTRTAAILMPLPDHDFDPTEAAIPWKACSMQGWKITICTETGKVPFGDLHRLEGPLPGLLSASQNARLAYREMTQDPAYLQPISYEGIDPSHYEALLLPGGDGLRVRQYLDSSILRSKVLQFYEQHKLIGAICHGILVLARTLDSRTGRSVLYGHKITALPKSLDRFGYLVDRWFLRRGYIMYSSCVADEVHKQLEHPDDMSYGTGLFKPYAVSDGALITSRWYLDAELFAQRFVDALRDRIAAA
jgi:putative intracellular protease/amidase